MCCACRQRLPGHHLAATAASSSSSRRLGLATRIALVGRRGHRVAWHHLDLVRAAVTRLVQQQSQAIRECWSSTQPSMPQHLPGSGQTENIKSGLGHVCLQGCRQAAGTATHLATAATSCSRPVLVMYWPWCSSHQQEGTPDALLLLFLTCFHAQRMAQQLHRNCVLCLLACCPAVLPRLKHVSTLLWQVSFMHEAGLVAAPAALQANLPSCRKGQLHAPAAGRWSPRLLRTKSLLLSRWRCPLPF
jgi:hypothetical protein